MKKNKKFSVITCVILCASLICTVFAACKVVDTGTDESNENSQLLTGSIHVVSREDGSGTRDAFTTLMEIVDENDNDILTQSAEITSSTAVMLKTVSGDQRAIGYVSLGSLSEDVKAVSINGVEPNISTVKDGTYMLQRPFIVAYKDGELTDISRDFISFIMSTEGQQIVEEEGYISVDANTEYVPADLSGVVTISGSTSVAPVMEVLSDRYRQYNPDVKIEIQQPGSGAGIEAAIQSTAQIAMSSRELEEEEKAVLTSVQIAKDGIAVIVNKSNQINDLSKEEIKSIFTGETTKWERVDQ